MAVNLVVLSNKNQLIAWRPYLNEGSWKILCDNPAFSEFLTKEKIEHVRVDEFWLREHWNKINRWACERAGACLLFSRDKGLFEDVDMASCVYFNFVYLLVALITNYLYAQRIIERYEPASVFVFDPLAPPDFPEFNGNSHLNFFLRHFARTSGIRVESISLAPKQTHPAVLKLSGFKAFLKKQLERFSAVWMRPASCQVLALGSLMHLSPVILAMKARGIKTAVYSHEFNWAQFYFALRHRLAYLTPKSFLPTANHPIDGKGGRHCAQLLQWVENACGARLFDFEGTDLGPFVKERIFGCMDAYSMKIKYWSDLYETISSWNKHVGWLLDEDVSTPNSYLAAFFNAKKTPVFCISHAHYPLSFQVSESYRVYRQSRTFVNSEYEKRLYEERGWAPEGLVVTGTPRYDRLLKMRERAYKRPKKNSRVKELFFCGSTLWYSDPAQPYYLGVHITNFGQMQVPSLEAITSFLHDPALHLTVKPHMAEDRETWKDFFRSRSLSGKVRVRKQPDDFFKLLLRSDVMLLSYWSTAIVESVICGKAVWVLDFLGLLSEKAPYISRGHCLLIKDKPSLARQIASLVSNNGWAQKPGNGNESAPDHEYYFGRQDGLNTRRVVQSIFEDLERG